MYNSYKLRSRGTLTHAPIGHCHTQTFLEGDDGFESHHRQRGLWGFRGRLCLLGLGSCWNVQTKNLKIKHCNLVIDNALQSKGSDFHIVLHSPPKDICDILNSDLMGTTPRLIVDDV